MPDPQDPNRITPPTPGSVPPEPGAERITPPWPVRLAESLQAVSDEMAQLLPMTPELGPIKADVDRALQRVKALHTETTA